MTVSDIIKLLESWRGPAQEINNSLKELSKPDDPHVWHNGHEAWTTAAHLGSMIDYELNLLRRLHAEGHERHPSASVQRTSVSGAR